MEERNMKGKLFVLLVGMALLVGMLSGCVETPEEPEEPENQAPTAGFTYDPMVNITTDTNITFTDTSTDTDGNISFWSWDFDGDGAEDSIVQNPEHTYDVDNTTYTVTLTVDDNDGATDTITKNVTVGTPPVAPTAAFDYDPTVNITVNETTVDFTDNSTAGNSAIENWTWDFGDGNYSYDQNATHMYTAIGNYTVTLTVTDENELSDTTEEITIEVIEAEA